MLNPPAARYEVRPANGTNHVFDRIWYGVVDANRNPGLAQKRADELNARKPGEQRKAPRR